ncbi:MAG: hypothetical protein HUK04_00390 [Bacteroidaceae bacterium]|mgnify:CR=1 FL=1|nr:hypothetical protein [Bacteroidaceae bacterium]
MATFIEHLKGINRYPIPQRTLAEVGERRSITLTADAAQEELSGKAYRLAKADLLLWLSLAPNISQGGQSYTFSEEQRKQMRNEANAIYQELEPTQATAMPTFGYKGSRL